MSFLAPKAPSLPPAAPSPPQASDPALQQARADEIIARRKAVGRSALLLTGGTEIPGEAPTIKTRLLGGS
jgi:hypothetical protein